MSAGRAANAGSDVTRFLLIFVGAPMHPPRIRKRRQPVGGNRAPVYFCNGVAFDDVCVAVSQRATCRADERSSNDDRPASPRANQGTTSWRVVPPPMCGESILGIRVPETIWLWPSYSNPGGQANRRPSTVREVSKRRGGRYRRNAQRKIAIARYERCGAASDYRFVKRSLWTAAHLIRVTSIE